MNKMPISGILCISPDFKKFLEEQISKRNCQLDFNLAPSWTSGQRLSDENIMIGDKEINGLFYHEVICIGYESNPKGVNIYSELVNEFYGS